MIYNLAIFDQKLDFDWFVFEKAYGKFIFMLNVEAESFECEKCPKELVKGDAENNYKDVIDVHIADGIDMGNITNMVKGVPEDELFGNCAPENSAEKKAKKEKAEKRKALIDGILDHNEGKGCVQ